MATRPSTYRSPFSVPASTLVSRSGHCMKYIRCLPAAASSGGPVPCAAAHVHLSAHYRTQFGEHLKLAGSCGELGSWDLDKAQPMQWTDGDYWVADLCLPAQEPINFKLVHVATNGQHWEPGNNKVLEVPSEEQMLNIHVAWGCSKVVSAPADARNAIAESAPADAQKAVAFEVAAEGAQPGATDTNAKPVDSVAQQLVEESHSVSKKIGGMTTAPRPQANTREDHVYVFPDGVRPW